MSHPFCKDCEMDLLLQQRDKCDIKRSERNCFTDSIPSNCRSCGHRLHRHTPEGAVATDQTISKDGHPCRDPFFSGMPASRESDDWLEFSSSIPRTENPKLYIRSSYKFIALNALLKTDSNRRKYAIVTGTPGIGKSIFVYYVLWMLIKDKKRVLFFRANGSIYFDGNSIIEYSKLPSATNRQFWAPDLWCIIDSNNPIAVIGDDLIHYCSVLLVTTLRCDFISRFKELVPAPNVFYMPIWTRDELEKIQSLFPGRTDVWLKRFECLGGVPRFVLHDITVDPEALLMQACQSCSVDDCIMFISIYSEINLHTKNAQMLIHVHSESPYETYQLRYASQAAVSIIARTKWASDRERMQRLLGSCAVNPLAAALCGYIFEPHAINLLEKGGEFDCREVVECVDHRMGIEYKKPRQTITIPKSAQPRQVVDKVESNQSAGQLYVPRAPNSAAIDAWIPEFGGFQMTVGKSRNIKGSAPDDLHKLGTKGNRLFVLLPPEQYFDSFSKTAPQSIQQYALLIPYPETIVEVDSGTNNSYLCRQ